MQQQLKHATQDTLLAPLHRSSLPIFMPKSSEDQNPKKAHPTYPHPGRAGQSLLGPRAWKQKGSPRKKGIPNSNIHAFDAERSSRSDSGCSDLPSHTNTHRVGDLSQNLKPSIASETAMLGEVCSHFHLFPSFG